MDLHLEVDKEIEKRLSTEERKWFFGESKRPRIWYIDWKFMVKGIQALAKHCNQNLDQRPKTIMGVERGGVFVSLLLQRYLDIPLCYLKKDLKVLGTVKRPVLVVDDVCDSGETFLKLQAKMGHFWSAVLFEKPWSRFKPTISVCTTTDWLVFPYELEVI